ncbi:energy transducer TonB [Flavivirga aquimarina]|uniref:Energy transducer TonB n=1 Tax=Flavivirga aquimarina TaxID=2027862 RepID=A0ABT8WGZ4_9FLAO|nr:energy transducer TonB [Flavivirga aquimarina]MDO5972435.1 energy transducer TonB [Flavivirga aquimarina]
MSNQKRTHELIRQNEQIVKKSQKHDANLQKNSTLYFQVGLIVCLLAAYGLLEMRFETTITDYGGVPSLEEPYSIDIPIIKLKPPTIIEPVEEQQKKLSDNFIEVPDDTPINPIVDVPTKDPVVNDTPIVDPEDIVVKDIPEEAYIPVDFVQVVPVYPGCEKKKTNEDRRKCMSEKINKLIQRKFDTDLGSKYGLSGKQVIHTVFKIDKTGKVAGIRIRASHPVLEKEAKRVINIIPEMTPAKQQNKNIGVMYTLPIVFQMNN